MALGTTLGSEVGARRSLTDLLLGGSGDGKPNYYCLGETMGVGSSGVCFDGSGEGYTLVELLGADGGAEIGYSNGV